MDPVSIIAADTLTTLGHAVDETIDPLRPALGNITTTVVTYATNVVDTVTGSITVLQGVCGTNGLYALAIICGGFLVLALGSAALRTS